MSTHSFSDDKVHSTFLLFLCNSTLLDLDLLEFALVHLIWRLVIMRGMEALAFSFQVRRKLALGGVEETLDLIGRRLLELLGSDLESCYLAVLW